MTYTPSIRSALLGLVAAIAALLIGITPSPATAATHANAQQPHPTTAAHATEKQPHPRNPAQPCPLNEPLGIGFPAYMLPAGQLPGGFATIYDGPGQGCTAVGAAGPGGRVTAYYTLNGYVYVTQGFFTRGWINDLDIDFAGSGLGFLPQGGMACLGTCPPRKLCRMGQRKCQAVR